MKKTILFFGKLPPPYIGPSFATELILKSELKNIFRLIHFDISHHSSIKQLGSINLTNIIFPFLLSYRLIKVLRTEKPDIVYIPSQQSALPFIRDSLFIFIVKCFKNKIVCHLRGGYFIKWYNETNFVMKLIIRVVQKFIDVQIVLGDNLKYMYEPFMAKEKIFSIPNGGNFNYNGLRKREDEKVNILFLGNFIKAKGIIDFLKASINLGDYNENINIEIVGSHVDCRDEINDLIKNNKNLSIKNYGVLSGREKKIILANADIFVFPTYYRNEGHPWVIIEAMAAGLPIISTDTGAIIESVIDNYNGFIIPKKNQKELTKKILSLVASKDLRLKMGNNSRKLYLEKFTEDVLVKNFVKVFQNI